MQLSQRSRFAVAVIALALGVAGSTLGVTPAPTPAPGAAAGTFTVAGKTIQLSHASTFRNDKSVVLLLTDAAVPSAGWKNAGDEMIYRMSGHKFGGVEFYLDEKHQVTQANYFESDGPSGAKLALELKLDSGTGKSLTGSAHSTPFGESQNSHLKLDVRFNAPLP